MSQFVLTFVFLIVIQASTDRRAPIRLAGIPIGLSFTLIHLIGIPVTNLSVNPVPIAGAALAGAVNSTVFEEAPQVEIQMKAAAG